MSAGLSYHDLLVTKKSTAFAYSHVAHFVHFFALSYAFEARACSSSATLKFPWDVVATPFAKSYQNNLFVVFASH